MARRLQQENKHNVGASQWKSWCDLAQRVFNATFEMMRDNQWAFQHPKTAETTKVRWKTTAYNAAWIAPDAVQQGLKDIAGGVGYYKGPKK